MRIVPVEISKRHVAEELVCFQSNLLVCGHQRYIRVLRGGSFVVIARSNLGIVSDGTLFFPGNQADLGVNLVLLESVDDSASGILQTLRPVNIVLLVKACAKLDKDRNVLPVLCCPAEIIHQLCFACQTVDGNLD